MKMTKTFTALCLSAALLVGTTLPAQAEITLVPQDLSAAPTFPAGSLQQLSWTPLDASRKQVTRLTDSSPQLTASGVTGAVAAYSLPANIGELTVTLSSEVKNNQVFAPNVLVLDENLRPAAWFPSQFFTYQEPGVMTPDRLEGVMKLTPVPGQQKIYLLVFTTEKDLTQTTTLLDPAKAYAKGTSNAIPDIPDPVARHSREGELKVQVKTNSGSSILVGPLFGSSGPAPVTIGSTQPVAPAPAPAVAAPPPAAKHEPIMDDTESYFNQRIQQAVKQGNIDKALKLLDEAERLGSTTARPTFISSVKGKG
ncbi:maltose operon protein MalM [Pantoea cypripedii]|uniref:Maltose operon protein MalM n=1 Tax=Pantoea cypripedii TaxID=55209 RepID=A0A6B9G2I8_PANCY|nr:maltose operon protein MalM [Pantoea cypripedii]QGY31761.1 maltose operon protein MalM [Pantoea cypripedii]